MSIEYVFEPDERKDYIAEWVNNILKNRREKPKTKKEYQLKLVSVINNPQTIDEINLSHYYNGLFKHSKPSFEKITIKELKKKKGNKENKKRNILRN